MNNDFKDSIKVKKSKEEIMKEVLKWIMISKDYSYKSEELTLDENQAIIELAENIELKSRSGEINKDENKRLHDLVEEGNELVEFIEEATKDIENHRRRKSNIPWRLYPNTIFHNIDKKREEASINSKPIKVYKINRDER